MANKTLVISKSIQLNSSKPFIAENNDVLRENFKKRSSIEHNYHENISLGSSVKFEAPDEILVNKVIQQVEYMFSDANISKDNFLLKHIRRNREGYVSLKLISSLRKVKALSKDWRVVAYSLKKSQKLVMNAEMTKVRRIDPLPLPKIPETSRTVLVFNYLTGGFEFEDLKKHLKIFGKVVSMVNVKSKADVKNAIVNKTLAVYERIASFPFAVVKFEKPEESINAVLHTSHPALVLRVVPLIDDKIESCKSSVSSVNGENERCIRAAESSTNFRGKKENVQLADFPKEESKPSFTCTSYAYKVNGTRGGKWIQRKTTRDKDISISKEPFVMILRLPKGPDGTKGFRHHTPDFVAFSMLDVSREVSKII